MMDRHLAILVLGIMLIMGLAIAARAQSGSHGDGHAERHDWYRDLKQPGTGWSCCNGTTAGREGDCRPTRAELRDGQWWALIDGQWRPVPWTVVLDPSLNREPIYAHICANKSGRIYCFIGAGAGI